mgnify:FL=1
MAAETYAWMPAVADWLLQLYVRFLPQETGERLLEEWRAVLDNMPGNIATLLVAVDLGRTMVFIKNEAKEIEELEEANRTRQFPTEIIAIDYWIDDAVAKEFA